MAPIFFNPTHTKLQKNIFSFGGFKRWGGGGCPISDFFGAKIHHFAIFF
jgi:hypothetical protein